MSPFVGGMLDRDLYAWASHYWADEGRGAKNLSPDTYRHKDALNTLIPRIPVEDQKDEELCDLLEEAIEVMESGNTEQKQTALKAVVSRLRELGPKLRPPPPPPQRPPPSLPPPLYKSGFADILGKLKRPPPPTPPPRVRPPPPPPRRVPPPPPPRPPTAVEELRNRIVVRPDVGHRGVDPGARSPTSPKSSPEASPVGSGLVGGLSPQAGFVMRMMAENKKKHSGQYKKPTDPKHPESTMSSWRPFDYKKLANARQGGESNTGYGASPFIQKHFKNGTVAYAPRGPNHQHLRDRGQPAEDEGQRNARKARRNLVALLRQAGVNLPQATQQALAEAPPPLEEAPPAPKRATPYKSGFKNILEKLKKPEPKNKGGRPKKEYEFVWDNPAYNKKARGRPKQTEEEKTFATGRTQAEREAEAEDERTGFHEGKWQEHEDRDKQEQEEAEARRKQKGRKYGLHKVEEKKEADRKAEAQRRKEEEEDRREAERERQREEREAQRKRDHEERLEAIKQAKIQEKEDREREKREKESEEQKVKDELNRNTYTTVPSWWKTLRKVKSMERKSQSDSHFEWFRGLAITVRESKEERLRTLTKTFLKWLFMKALPSKGWKFVEYEPREEDFPPEVESNSYAIKDKQGREIPGAFAYKNGKERVSGDRIALMGITSYRVGEYPKTSEHPLPSKMFIVVPPTGVGYVLYGRINKEPLFDWDGITKCFLQSDYRGNESKPLHDGSFSLNIQMKKEGDRWVNMVDRYTEGSEYSRNDMKRKEKIPYVVNGREVKEWGLYNKDIMPYFSPILNALDEKVPVPEESLDKLPVEARLVKIKGAVAQD